MHKHGHYPAPTDGELFKEYLANHDKALNFAIRNRALIAKRLLDQIQSQGQEALLTKEQIEKLKNSQNGDEN